MPESKQPHVPIISIDTPTPPPYWALLEWELIRNQTAAVKEFYARYFDERGYLIFAFLAGAATTGRMTPPKIWRDGPFCMRIGRAR